MHIGGAEGNSVQNSTYPTMHLRQRPYATYISLEEVAAELINEWHLMRRPHQPRLE